MIDFKKEIANIIYSEELGLEVEEIVNMVEVPTDKKHGGLCISVF